MYIAREISTEALMVIKILLKDRISGISQNLWLVYLFKITAPNKTATGIVALNALTSANGPELYATNSKNKARIEPISPIMAVDTPNLL